jgi:hypothetical protein
VLLAAGTPRTLGSADPRLRLAAPGVEDAFPRRTLRLDGRAAFDLSPWCGTCGVLFQRLEGANEKLAVRAATDRLTEGVEDPDDPVAELFGALLPRGSYRPLLLELRPRLVRPAAPGDYFAEEQVRTWGVDPFWDLPESPRTPYYRTWQTRVADDAHLYEFVVPMVPPSWNEAAVVDRHRELLAHTARPTAVALTTLDVCAPATDGDGDEWYWHWALTHFLLDGHHKLQAAAEEGRAVRLLALLSLDGSLAEADALGRLPELRARPAAGRRATPRGSGG